MNASLHWAFVSELSETRCHDLFVCSACMRCVRESGSGSGSGSGM